MPRRPKTHRPPKAAGVKRHAKPRLKTAERGYGGRWQKYRLWFLARHPVCAMPGCGRGAVDVDHIRPVTGPGDSGFWDTANHQALCHPCHARKTAAEDGGFGNPKKGEGE